MIQAMAFYDIKILELLCEKKDDYENNYWRNTSDYGRERILIEAKRKTRITEIKVMIDALPPDNKIEPKKLNLTPKERYIIRKMGLDLQRVDFIYHDPQKDSTSRRYSALPMSDTLLRLRLKAIPKRVGYEQVRQLQDFLTKTTTTFQLLEFLESLNYRNKGSTFRGVDLVSKSWKFEYVTKYVECENKIKGMSDAQIEALILGESL